MIAAPDSTEVSQTTNELPGSLEVPIDGSDAFLAKTDDSLCRQVPIARIPRWTNVAEC